MSLLQYKHLNVDYSPPSPPPPPPPHLPSTADACNNVGGRSQESFISGVGKTPLPVQTRRPVTGPVSKGQSVRCRLDEALFTVPDVSLGQCFGVSYLVLGF